MASRAGRESWRGAIDGVFSSGCGYLVVEPIDKRGRVIWGDSSAIEHRRVGGHVMPESKWSIVRGSQIRDGIPDEMWSNWSVEWKVPRARLESATVPQGRNTRRAYIRGVVNRRFIDEVIV